MALTAIAACSTSDDLIPSEPLPQPQPEKHTVSLMMSFSSANAEKSTRMPKAASQNDDKFRGIEDLKLIPFDNNGTQMPQLTKQLDYIEDSHYYYYQKDIDVNIGTKTFICYAKAKNTESYNSFQNGAFTATFDNTGDYTKTTFSAVTIPNGDDTKRTAIENYLTNIAQAGGWYTTDNPDKKAQFNLFINSKEGVISSFAGSSANILHFVKNWYQKISDEWTGDALKSAVLNAIKEGVMIEDDEIVSLKENLQGYPTDLPDGAAVIKWNNGEQCFKYETEAPNRTDNYVYPAELYYTGRSIIYTSATSREGDYIATPRKTWEQICESYENKGTDGQGATVDATTRSVAIVNPLDYGVACLKLRIKAAAQQDESGYYLRDGNEEYTQQKVRLTDNAFPLTGILIAGQPHQLDYEFKPVAVEEGQTARECIIYDKIYDKSIADEQVYLGTTSSTPLYTLAMQSREDMTAKVVLEFRNDSGQDFKNADGGIIYQGTKFYMVASILPASLHDYDKQVFTADHYTDIQLNIKSLAHAYNALPDLSSDELRLIEVVQAGVKEWEAGQNFEQQVYNW